MGLNEKDFPTLTKSLSKFKLTEENNNENEHFLKVAKREERGKRVNRRAPLQMSSLRWPKPVTIMASSSSRLHTHTLGTNRDFEVSSKGYAANRGSSCSPM